MTREEKAKQIADDLSNFVNSYSDDQFKELAKLMVQDHRTLIQGKTRLIILYLELLNELYMNGWYDARDEASVTFAHKVMTTIPEAERYLPYI